MMLKSQKKVKKRKREIDDDDEEVQVNFDFFHPVPEDAKDISGLLRKYLDDGEFHSMDMADLIIEEGKAGQGIGTVVSTNEGEDVVGFISCIDLKFHEKKTGVIDIVKYIKNITLKHGSSSSSFILSSLSPTSTVPSLSSNDLHFGLLLCERLVNIPPEITPHLYNSLFKEIRAIVDVKSQIENEGKDKNGEKKKNKDVNNNEYLNFNRYIIISHIVMMNDLSADVNKSEKGGKMSKNKELSTPKGGKMSKNKKMKFDDEELSSTFSSSWSTSAPLPLSLSNEDTIFLHPEDEVFLRLSLCAFTFPIVNDSFKISVPPPSPAGSSSSSSSSIPSLSIPSSSSSSGSSSPSSASSSSGASSSFSQGLLIVLDQNGFRQGINELYGFFGVQKIE